MRSRCSAPRRSDGLVRGSRQGAVQPVEAAGGAPAGLCDGSGRRLVLAGTFNFSLAVFARLLGLTQTVGEPPASIRSAKASGAAARRRARRTQRFMLAHRGRGGNRRSALLVLIGFVTGLVRTMIREFGFRLDRTDAGCGAGAGCSHAPT